MKTKYVGCYKSAAISTNQDVSHLQGTVKWVAHSPFRPKHKRKNWFIDISIFEESPKTDFCEEGVRYQTFHCGGHGGQNVNKVETGVRAIHVPTGLSVSSSKARTQYLNKKIALARLSEIIARQNLDGENLMKQTM
jgi:peptide chain release factor